ncbi:hypothetical protein F5Y13DRAFT_187720 [Hypoxylon sp. FL1857]|nr:hypothetical protein F5Y13DRAFT_187720 [Hypoxylon sp. FL1857]
MRPSYLIALALTMCGGALARPRPSRVTYLSATRVVEHEPATTPDCAAIEEYCKCLDGDFDCQTDPSCEWCRDHNAWQSPTSAPPPPPSSTTSKPASSSEPAATPQPTTTTTTASKI